MTHELRGPQQGLEASWKAPPLFDGGCGTRRGDTEQLRGLSHNTAQFLTALQAGSPRSGCQHSRVLGEDSLPGYIF